MHTGATATDPALLARNLAQNVSSLALLSPPPPVTSGQSTSPRSVYPLSSPLNPPTKSAPHAKSTLLHATANYLALAAQSAALDAFSPHSPVQIFVVHPVARNISNNPRKGKGQGLRVKKACAGCRAEKVQCDAESVSTFSGLADVVKRNTSNVLSPVGLVEARCPDVRANRLVTQIITARRGKLDHRDAAASPSSPESPLSPHSPHDYTPVCAPAPDSHDSASQGHEPPTPTPSPSPVFLAPPYPSQLSFATSQLYPIGPPRAYDALAHILPPALDPREMRSYAEEYEESSGSSMSAFPPHPLQVSATVASLYDTTARPFQPRSYSEDYRQRPVSLAPCHPSERGHATARTSDLRSYSEDYRQYPVSPPSFHLSHQRGHTGSYDFPTVSYEPAPAVSPLEMHSHPQDEAFPTPPPLSSYPPQPQPYPTAPPPHPTAPPPHPTASSAGPPALPPYYVRNDFRYDATGTASQPVQRSSPYDNHPTRAGHEPPKVTLPSFAEAFPEFVGFSVK
ncbi:hypothetical protein BU17DRAFT_100769 [Hysterangium stoloniferum]|nr:hypothetical protein BU17DRAFT_100769 [Hysterangium stoloniferum]